MLHAVSLTLGAGETLAVVGPSGAGKTTLARLASGLLPPSAGSVWIGGTNLALLPPAAMRRLRGEVQLVWQDPQRSLDPKQSVAEIVAEGLELQSSAPGLPISRRRRQWREAVAAEWLPQVGLDAGLARRRPGELSGGQRQRVALARALAVQPRLLIADEPTAALDPPTGRQILERMAEMQARAGLACLLITHHPAQAAGWARRIAVLDAGAIVETGAAAEVLARPAHPLTRRLLAAQPPWPPENRAPLQTGIE